MQEILAYPRNTSMLERRKSGEQGKKFGFLNCTNVLCDPPVKGVRGQHIPDTHPVTVSKVLIFPSVTGYWEDKRTKKTKRTKK